MSYKLDPNTSKFIHVPDENTFYTIVKQSELTSECIDKIAEAVLEKMEVAKAHTRGWIPCSERLPEEDGNYLIWFRYENALGDLSESMAMEYYADSTGWDCDNVEVIAWHPLPDPYKGAKMEAAEPERKTGKWIHEKEMQCSCCGFTCDDPYYLGAANYCPNCGAKMEVGR